MAADRKFWVFLLGIVLFGGLLRGYGITSQPPTRDDVLTAFSAVQYMESGQLGPIMWNHPALRNIAVYISMNILGTGAWGIKMASLLSGTLSVLFLGLVARRIFRDRVTSLLAAFFLTVDVMHIYFSRQAIQEVYMAFFMLAGIYCALRFMDTGKPILLIVSGLLFGLGIASKWYVVFPLLVTSCFLLYRSILEGKGETRKILATAIFIFSALLLLPFAVYLLTFLPWFSRGYGLSEWVSLQHAMYLETITHSGYNPYHAFEIDNQASLWFLKPVAVADFTLAEGHPRVFLGISNPLVWLLTIPSVIYLTYEGIKRKIPEYLYVGALFFVTYVPMLLSSRPLWPHTAFSVLPFALMAIALMLVRLLARSDRGKRLFAGYVLALVLASIPLYLLAIGKGMDIGPLKPIVDLYRPAHERQF